MVAGIGDLTMNKIFPKIFPTILGVALIAFASCVFGQTGNYWLLLGDLIGGALVGLGVGNCNDFYT